MILDEVPITQTPIKQDDADRQAQQRAIPEQSTQPRP